MDNCAGQNKNYTLFTSVIAAVNGPSIAADTVTFRYLEAGHTFMSADSYRAAVEKQFKNKVNILDFEDLTTCIENAKAKVVTLSYAGFRSYEGQQSQSKLKKANRPMLSDIRVAEFRRGHKVLFYKSRQTDEQYYEFDYLKQKCNLQEPTGRLQPRGVPIAKKEDLVKILTCFIPYSRQIF